jgi:EAL domain-containing protein (putative c-di-GMP-specific phosphodiesterase class I)
VKIAMDDFGRGYSSLSLLSEIPIDRLRIDRSFVTGMADRSESSRMIRAILGLAGELGLDTVIEGVEEHEQYQRLQELGCQACQGYYFAKPQPAPQLVELLQRAALIHTV